MHKSSWSVQVEVPLALFPYRLGFYSPERRYQTGNDEQVGGLVHF